MNFFIDTKEILPGIFIARCILSREKPLVKILNINSEEIEIPHLSLQYESLNNYDVVTNNDNTSHKDQIMERLSKNFPDYVNKDLTDLCLEYSDVFALPTDKLTCNNFYNQKLRVKDKTPIYIKNYRILKHIKPKYVNKCLKC